MILDTLDNASKYIEIHPGLAQFFENFKIYTPENYRSGRKELDGENAFLILKEYETACTENAFFEAHNTYCDVMYMVEGEEIVYVKPRARLSHITKEYNEKEDALLAELDSDCTAVLISAGQFLILFPEDAHCPERIFKQAKKVKKIVGKLKMNNEKKFNQQDVSGFACATC